MRLRRAALTAAALAPVGLLAWVLLGSSLLAVDRVEVVGAARTDPAAVLAAAAVLPGTPLARVDAAGAEQRVAGLPAVAEVRLVRDWPGTVRLEVTERTPVAVVAAGSAWTVLDASGTAFAEEPAAPAGLAVLEVARPGPGDPDTAAGLAVLAELPTGLRDRVAVVRVDGPRRVVLELADAREVVWGEPGEAAVKGAAAEALLALPGDVVDVSSPRVAVVR